MGWKFGKSRRSIKILPGVRLNVGKKGINSVSIGGRGKVFGATTNVNLKTGKTKHTYSIKGVGSISHTPDTPKKVTTTKRSPSVAKTPSLPTQQLSPKSNRVASTAKKWHQKNWVIILFLVFFPIVGIPLAWFSGWSKQQKWIATGLSAVWFIYTMATNPEPQPTPQNTPVAEAPLIEPSPASIPPIPTEQSIEPVVQQTAYQEALDLMASAQTFAENAVSADDWNVVTAQFEQAIKLFESVPAQDANYAAAQDSLKRSSYALSFARKQELPPADPFPEAIKAAMNAANLTQTASFTSEWRQIVEQWEAAIQHLSNVPESSPNYETAQAKMTEYSKNQAYAQDRIKALTASSTTTTSTGQSKGSITPARSPRSGSCQCPYDYDSRGRSCGDRSAYSRPGGDAPMCYIRVE